MNQTTPELFHPPRHSLYTNVYQWWRCGGPLYLYRFCAEQTITVNTTAADGNAALLAA
jgi:hypothetical protein